MKGEVSTRSYNSHGNQPSVVLHQSSKTFLFYKNNPFCHIMFMTLSSSHDLVQRAGFCPALFVSKEKQEGREALNCSPENTGQKSNI